MLAHSGITKSNGYREKKIVLSLLINSKGYPFAWDILEDYTADVKTLKGLLIKWKEQFKISDNEMILVFDRGMVSDANPKHLEDQKYFYIATLDKSQISNIENINIDRFETLTEENILEQITQTGFIKYNDETYYSDFGMIDDRCDVLVFNPTMFVDERKSRDEAIQKAKAYLEEENKLLLVPKKSRNKTTTGNRINEKLKKMGAIKFMDYTLDPIVIKDNNKEIKSFHITILTDTKKAKENIKKAGRTDGLWVIVTNICSKEDGLKEFMLPELISKYIDKNHIEEAFKNVKSFIKIHPFYVWTSKHIKAHYTICVLSYLLNVTIANRLRKKDIDIKSPQKVHEMFKRGIVGEIDMCKNNKTILKLVRPNYEEIEILKLFGNEHCTITSIIFLYNQQQ